MPRTINVRYICRNGSRLCTVLLYQAWVNQCHGKFPFQGVGQCIFECLPKKKLPLYIGAQQALSRNYRQSTAGQATICAHVNRFGGNLNNADLCSAEPLVFVVETYYGHYDVKFALLYEQKKILLVKEQNLIHFLLFIAWYDIRSTQVWTAYLKHRCNTIQ